MPQLPTGTVTFLFTDIEGSTRRWEHQPEAMRAALARHDALVRAAIYEHDGHVVKTMGDAFHAAFARAPDALAAAVDAQRRLAAEPWGEIGSLRVRMALHTGAAEEREGDYYGPPLNRAARLLSVGHGGQVLLSQVTAELVRDSLPSDVRLLDLGQQRLKDLTEPERVSQVVAPDLASDFPPLASLDARPHNLPTHPTALLGRERELAELRGLFGEGARLVTLTGPGGTGKTRLSLQVAADLLDDFEHGVFLVELALISDPALVPATIAQTLGVRDVGGRPVLDPLRDFTRAKSLLLVLDNFEQILPAASVVRDLLTASPGLKALVTSREPLRLRGEREYAVPSLALPDAPHQAAPETLAQYAAVALFLERAVAIRADFAVTAENAPAVVEVCARLDGLPLAIELAAARVRMLTPEAMLGRLERRLPLLTGGARDLPTRQQTLRGTIAWSHDLLDEPERCLFRRLSVFIGGWSLAAADAVCDLGDLDVDVLDDLESLASKSLIRRSDDADGEPRFGMLETIREFALERLEESGEEARVRRRHARHYLEVAERAEPELRRAEQGAWLNRLEAEHGNMRAALRFLAEEDEVELSLRLGGALSHFWNVSGYHAEGRARLAEVLRPAGTRAHPASRAKVLCELGFLTIDQGDDATARVLIEESLSILRARGDRHGVARALVGLAWIANDEGDFSMGRALHEESLSIMRALGDGRGIALALNGLGYFASVQSDHAAARACHEESLAIMRALGDRHGVSRALVGLGWVGIDQQDHVGARTLLAESLAIAHGLGYPRVVIDGLETFAYQAVSVDRMDRAARLHGAAETLRETIGVQLTTMERALYDPAAVRASLELAAAWAEGRAMTLEQAVAYALEGPSSTR